MAQQSCLPPLFPAPGTAPALGSSMTRQPLFPDVPCAHCWGKRGIETQRCVRSLCLPYPILRVHTQVPRPLRFQRGRCGAGASAPALPAGGGRLSRPSRLSPPPGGGSSGLRAALRAPVPDQSGLGHSGKGGRAPCSALSQAGGGWQRPRLAAAPAL